jgi:anthranilate phosphoribosyltransferase
VNQAKTEMSDVLDSLIHRRDLTEAQSAYAMEELLQGNLSDAEISAFITLLRAKGETASELASLIPTMWDFSPDVSSVDASGSIDTCGTGGDNSGTINISTAASFVVAACGVPVAKHGNRAASSKCGAADVLEELGVSTQLSAEQSMQLFNELHYAFLFAPTFHPGMRFAAPVRSQLKVRTTFNFLGPLANPFHAPYRLHGVSDASILNVYAHTLDELGVERAYVFHGHGGLDEISLSGPSSGLFLDGHTITPVDIDPADYGIAYTDASTTGRCRRGDKCINHS